MGAGHDGAARELARRLQTLGFTTTVRDFLETGPLGIGAALRKSYELQLRYLPASYEATYRMWFRIPRLCPPLARFVAMLTGRTLLKWIGEARPVAIVSTYPLATLSLGELRRTGRLACPVVNYITDFGVHPLWIHPAVDLNLAVHDSAAELARLRSRGRSSVACEPAVSGAFGVSRKSLRVETRADLGLDNFETAVLVVAGSWGVGSVEDTVRAVAAHRRFVPVVACGNDRKLLARLRELIQDESIRAIAVGWTDDMPALMTACDAVVENAGGLTAFEAMRSGLPVVTYNPIPGHGRENSTAMSLAGVARVAADQTELRSLLDALTRPGPARAAQVSAGEKLFGSDPAGLIAEMLSEEHREEESVGTPA